MLNVHGPDDQVRFNLGLSFIRMLADLLLLLHTNKYIIIIV